MKKEYTTNSDKKALNYFMNPKNWWGPLLFILIISVAGVGLIGYQTYYDAPPITGFETSSGEHLISKSAIEKGQIVFHKYALMEYGSMFGDGAQRGPDFTAEALHLTTELMNGYHIDEFKQKNGRAPSEFEIKVIAETIIKEIKENRYHKNEDMILLTDAQAYAVKELRKYYTDLFLDTNDDESFPPPNYITDRQELADLSDFFFWGAWVCAAKRPGNDFSYTHNWPYDPAAGNTPTSPVVLWSVLGLLAFVLACGIVLYFIGQYNQLPNRFFKQGTSPFLTTDRVSKFRPTKTQKASFKFFFVAIILFLLQVLCGVITINEFVDFLGLFWDSLIQCITFYRYTQLAFNALLILDISLLDCFIDIYSSSFVQAGNKRTIEVD